MMTEIEEMQYVIDRDPEFETLLLDAINNATGSPIERRVDELMILKNNIGKDLSVREFIAKYKVILGWSAMMGKILNKIHRDTAVDPDGLHPINGTKYNYIIYQTLRPWRTTAWLDTQTGKVTSQAEVAVRPKPDKNQWRKAYKGIQELPWYPANIEFVLTNTVVVTDLTTGKPIPNLLGSTMTVALYDHFTPSILISKEDFKVKHFTPAALESLLKDAFHLI